MINMQKALGRPGTSRLRIKWYQNLESGQCSKSSASREPYSPTPSIPVLAWGSGIELLPHQREAEAQGCEEW